MNNKTKTLVLKHIQWLSAGMPVVATQNGFYDNSLRRGGDVFDLLNPDHFSSRWMARDRIKKPDLGPTFISCPPTREIPEKRLAKMAKVIYDAPTIASKHKKTKSKHKKTKSKN